MIESFLGFVGCLPVCFNVRCREHQPQNLGLRLILIDPASYGLSKLIDNDVIGTSRGTKIQVL